MWLFLALLMVPLIEIALFIEIGDLIGLWPTIAIVILTALIGTILLRQQGFAAIRDVQQSLQGGGDPGAALAHGALILVSGIVLLTPGFFTDAIGFLLLVPPVRSAVIAFMRKRMTVVYTAHGARAEWSTGHPAGHRGGPRTVDGSWEDVTDRTGHGGSDTAGARPEIPEPGPRRPGERPSGWTTGADDDR